MAYQNQILKAVKDEEKGQEPKNEMKLGKNLAEPNWLKKFGAWWPRMRNAVPDATFSITNSAVNYAGRALDRDSASGLTPYLAGVFGKSYDLKGNITMPKLGGANVGIETKPEPNRSDRQSSQRELSKIDHGRRQEGRGYGSDQ